MQHADRVVDALRSAPTVGAWSQEARTGTRVWDAATLQTITPYLMHGGHVTWVEFSPDGRYVLTANGETVRLWQAATGAPAALAALALA